MSQFPPPQSREKLGWSFLVGGFGVLIFTCAAAAFFAAYQLENAKRPLTVLIEARQGTVRYNDATGLQRAISTSDAPQEINPFTEILTDAPVSAAIAVYPTDKIDKKETQLAQALLYSNAVLQLNVADKARFSSSEQPRRLHLTLSAGRMQLIVPPTDGPPTQILVVVPQGEILIERPGRYTLIAADDKTQTAVLSGQARVNVGAQTIPLVSDQRLDLLASGGVNGPLAPQADLLQDGDFSQSATAVWHTSNWEVERPGQPQGSVKFIQGEERSRLQVLRNGQGHAEVSVSQAIPQSEPTSSLWLQLAFRLIYHDLDVCGFQGSECPLFVQIAYTDIDGAAHLWQQGFYGHGDASDVTPYACFSCGGVQSAHDQVELEATFIYDIDLAAELARQGARPIQEVTGLNFVFSGHSFAVEINEARLLTMEETE